MTTRSQPQAEPSRQERREFIRAFTEHVWAHPGVDRPSVRPQTVATVAAVVTLLALLVGVGWELISPSPIVAATVPLQTPAAHAYAAVSGWDCAAAPDHGFDIVGRTSEWYTVASGGWTQDGCHGTFEAIPLSGAADRETSGQAALWWFVPGPAYSRCDVAVYVPKAARPQDAAATLAAYVVLAGRNGGVLAEFAVNQTTSPGRWVPAGTFPSGQEGLAVRLGNRGVPATSASRLALAQVRVTCSY